MRLEVRTFAHSADDKVSFFYDIVDLDDVILFQGKELPELVTYSKKGWSKEETARSNGLKHIKEILNDKG